MKFLRMAIQLALRSLKRNKMRSALTALGVVIGVGAVIAMIAVGQGASSTVQQQLASLGSKVLMVFPGATTAAGVRSGWGGASTLTRDDALAIRTEVPGVVGVAYFVRQVVQALSGNQNWSTLLYGAGPEFAAMRDWRLASGDFFTERDERLAARVCVIGQTVVENLFGSGQNPLGATVRVRGVPLQVIGVLEPKGQAMWGQDQDDLIVVPFSTAERRILGSPIPGTVHMILVKGATGAELGQLAQEIGNLLRQRHRIAPGEDNDFTVRSTAELTDAMRETSRTLTWLLGSVAAISLLVGGIGIMNTLLVSVTERTREIGIRLAVGAKGRHILAQFLVESMVLSLAGGLGGVVLGLAIAQLLAGLAHWPVVYSPLAVVGSLAFAAAVGVFFGLYPARRASRLDPVEALRYE